MPIYSYACTSCDNVFEIMKPVSRFDAPEECPDCKASLKRQVTLPGKPVFVGPGFHSTDYGKYKRKPNT